MGITNYNDTIEDMKIEAGFKQSEVGLIPSDWDVITFGDAFYFLNTATYSRAELSENSEVKYIHYGDIHVRWNHFLDFGKNALPSVSNEKVKNYSLIQDGDLIMADASEDYSGVGKCVEVQDIGNEKAISGLHTYLMRDKGTVFVNGFRGYIHSNSIVKKQLDKLATGMKVYGVSKSNLKTIFIPRPPIKEQTLIATALNDADALISSLEKLIAKKRMIKQGAMQKLLAPNKGRVLTKLGDIIYLQGGYAFKSDLFTDIGIPIIRISDVFNDKIDTNNSVCYKPFNIPKEFIVMKGDVLIAMSGATTGKIGVYKDDKLAYINQRVGKFIVLNDKKTSSEFISHIVRSEKFKTNLTKEIAQGAQPNISGKQIESIEVYISPNKSDQDYIATILSDMDSDIEILEMKLEKQRMIKAGMMQQLLTGKIRLI